MKHRFISGSTGRKETMKKFSGFVMIGLLVACLVPAAVPSPCAALEEGEVTGKVEGVDGKFLRDYETLNYKGEKKWKEWGNGLKSLGWIKVQGDSGELKDLFLLVIDTRTRIVKPDGSQGAFSDFKAGQKAHASYRMGWDALHAQEVKILE
jgi:hypothetical protein